MIAHKYTTDNCPTLLLELSEEDILNIKSGEEIVLESHELVNEDKHTGAWLGERIGVRKVRE